MVQRVFRMRDDETVEVARVEGEKVTGPQAEQIEKLLRQNGWPKLPPHFVLHGSYLWAERPTN